MENLNKKSSVSILGSLVRDCIGHSNGEKQSRSGGSALYASLASSFYSHVHLIGAVGNDWDPQLFELWEKREVLTHNVLNDLNQPSFYWEGEYTEDLSDVKTVTLNENVYLDFQPTLLKETQESFALLLGNCHPNLQRHVLSQTQSQLTALDTISIWIEIEKERLTSLIKDIDILFINDHEAKQLSGYSNLYDASNALLELGCSYVVIKKGEHGAFIQSQDKLFITPAYPTRNVLDTTGAGDSFAGAFLDYCSQKDNLSWDTLQQAMLWGTAVSSITVEGYGIDSLSKSSLKTIEPRYQFLKAITQLQ